MNCDPQEAASQSISKVQLNGLCFSLGIKLPHIRILRAAIPSPTDKVHSLFVLSRKYQIILLKNEVLHNTDQNKKSRKCHNKDCCNF